MSYGWWLLLLVLGCNCVKQPTKKSGIPDVKEVAATVEDNEQVLVLFYDPSVKAKNKLVLKILEKLDLKSYDGLPFVKSPDANEALEYGIEDLPKLALFEDGLPEVFPGEDLTELAQIKTWLKDELENNNLDVLELTAMEKYAKTGKPLLAVFVEDSKQKLANEESLLSICDKFDVNAVVVDDDAAVSKYGLDELPAYVYFEDGVPTVFEDHDDDADQDDTVLDWIAEQRTSDTIEEVTEEMLRLLAVGGLKEYVAVFFTGPCNENAPTDQECERVLRDLEEIDDELDDFGITLVTTEDIKYAGNTLKVRTFPSLGIFRNGDFKAYEGSLKVPVKDLMSWLIDEETLEIEGQIEEVNVAMLNRFLKDEEHAIVFFYDEDKTDSRELQEALKSLEIVDDKLDKLPNNTLFVKCSDDSIAQEFGFDQLPILVYFENQIPIVYDGKLTNDRDIYAWIVEELESDEIRTLEPEILDRLVDRAEDLVVVFYDETKKKHKVFYGRY